MIARRTVLVGIAALSAAPALAQNVQLISPTEAHAGLREGRFALVDVRTPGEWSDGGIAEGAETIAMQDPALGAKLDALTGGDRSAPIALICRTGARSGAVAAAMAKAGYTNVYSVAGGMLGSSEGPGWKRSGLPTEAKK